MTVLSDDLLYSKKKQYGIVCIGGIYMTLNQRRIKLLEECIYSEEVSISTISRSYVVSRQTVYDDIGMINFWLQQHNLGKISLQDATISSNFIDVLRLSEILAVMALNLDLFDREARLRFIVFNLLNNQKMTLDILNDKIPVSKSTLVNDMKALRFFFRKQGISLTYQRPGYHFSGDEKTIRIVLLNYLLPYTQYFITLDAVFKYLPFLQKSQGMSDISKMSLDILALALYISEVRVQGKNILFENTITTSTFTQAESNFIKEIQEFMPNFIVSGGERQYFIYILHCFGRFPTNIEAEDAIRLLSNHLLLNIQLVTTQVVNIEKLRPILYEHVCSMYFRMKLGLILFNETLPSIKKKYGYTYLCSQKILQAAIPFVISESVLEHEASYLSILMQTHLQEKDVPMTALIVCYQGISVSKLVTQQIEQLGIPLQVIGETSPQNIQHFKTTDVIISTTPLTISHPKIVYVNPILVELDYKKIMSVISMGNVHMRRDKKLLEIIKNHVTELQFIDIMQEYLYLIPFKKYTSKRERGEIMLENLLTQEFIQYIEGVDSWEEAIFQVAKPLLNKGYINDSYIEKIIENVKEQGEYIVLRDGFALPHARPEDGVNQIGMSFLKIREPVFLNDNPEKPIKVFVMLAAEDAQKHLKALSELVDFIAEDEDFDKILNTETSLELLDLLGRKK